MVEEPGRRIVVEELEKPESKALPWRNPRAFARRAIEVALSDRSVTGDSDGWVFFDRGLVDAAAALERLTATPVLMELAKHHPYHEKVFLAPPWKEIYSQDNERRHGFDEASEEYSRLLEAYTVLEYQIVMIPKIAVSDRADFIIEHLSTE